MALALIKYLICSFTLTLTILLILYCSVLYCTVLYCILSFSSFQEFEAPKGVLDLHMVTTNNQKMFKVDLGGIFATVSTDTQSQQAIDMK